MLEAYIDDTEYQQDPPLFMLAGYLAPTEAWRSLSIEWRAALEVEPRIRYLKVKQALKAQGPFYRMTERQRVERMAMFRAAIEKWVAWQFAIVFRVDWLREVFAPLGKPHTSPYYYAERTLISELCHYLAESNFKGQQLDVVFDNRSIEQNTIVEAWKSAAAGASDTSVYSILKNPPRFRDDIEVLPLQAADMHATFTRLQLTENLAEEDLPGFKRGIGGFLLFPDKAEMQSGLTEFLRWHADNYPRR